MLITANLYNGYNSDNFIKKSNIIISILPSTNKTDNLIDLKFLKKMKKNSLLINIGRGNVLNEDDLLKYLKINKNFFVSLDVFNSLFNPVVCIYNNKGFGIKWFLNKLSKLPSSRVPKLNDKDNVLSVFQTIILQDIAIIKGIGSNVNHSYLALSDDDKYHGHSPLQ